MPDDLRSQFPIVREIAAMMNIPIRELEGYEADDVIGTLTKRATAAGVDTMIVSGDLDGLQLVDDHVRLLTTRMGVAATVIYDEAQGHGALRPSPRPDARLQGAQGRHVATTSPACREWGRRPRAAFSSSSARSTASTSISTR